MNAKERVLRAVLRKPVDRVPMTDAPWKETIVRWKGEGLPENKHPHDYFEFDIRYSYFIDGSPMLKTKDLEHTEDYVRSLDNFGREIKIYKNFTSPPEILNWMVGNGEDWVKIKERFAPSLDRVSLGFWGDYFDDLRPSGKENILKAYAKLDDPENTFVLINTLECYETAMRLVGDEHLLIMMATNPELVKDIFSTVAKTIIGTIEEMIGAGIKFDGVFFGGDIAYKNGLLFSPAMYRELLYPFHKTLFSFVKSIGKIVFYHTDGNCEEIIGDLISAGVDVLQPLEVKAGMDLEKAKKKWGECLSFMGNIDVRAILANEKTILAELNRKVPLGLTGGYIYHSDHSIPPEVSFDKFSRLVEIVRNTKNPNYHGVQ